ncbi:hypothetical protein HYH02_012357 [Chlamydomonas schloesseri]|uniref:Guanylate cyclase domain-containing protein n=1 Tax=Chlamydomonas schloesseri TaxID=2026947 RepID=A0A835VYU2_9CHLO|nr:hypothetical protein HYH02_012357 [Chlamydomonas schloesseri]|eukprot:KAG2434337.1 hypothetical protein HYH02_012357 [Chlamydomonas schloesseri]
MAVTRPPAWSAEANTVTSAEHLVVVCGLHPSQPTLRTLAADHSRRALVPGADERLAVVDVLVEKSKANVTVNARAVGRAEAAVEVLLRAHAAGNTSWLRQLNASAAAGAELPAEVLTPRLGSADGPAAAPLLLLYRRDWWQRLVEIWGLGGNSGDDSGSGGGSGNTTFAEQLLPPTWDLLVRLLGVLRNSDLDGNGSADHVLCADLQPGCKGWAVLAAVYASVAQTQGTQQGMWFNATDLRPAVGGPAMQAALQTYAALAASNAAPFTPGGAAVSLSNVSVSPDDLLQGGGGSGSSGGGPACGAVNPLFAAGRCLFTIDWATAALRLTQNDAQGMNMTGHVGAAPLPGSTLVANRSASSATQLQPCTPLSCPNASASDSAQLAAAEQLLLRLQAAAKDVPPTAAPTQQPAPPPQGPQPQLQPPLLLVNRAPLLGEASPAWAVEPRQAAASYLRTDDFVRLVDFELGLKGAALLAAARARAAGAGSGTGNSSSAIGAGTMVSSLAGATATAAALVAMSAPEAAQLLDLHPADLAAVAQAVGASLDHPNAAVDISLPYSAEYRAVLDDLAASMLQLVANTTAVGNGSAAPEDQVAVLTASASVRVVAVGTAFPYPAILLRLYWQATGFTPPSQAGDGGTNSSEGNVASTQSAALRIGLPVAVAVGGALALALLGVVCYAFVARRRASERALFRAMKPPGAGPTTTLVMTDVQNSTLLWEVLDVHVMDECLSLHHHVMREAIAANRGYEVFTEGDAFCVVFYSPDSALGFALHVQEHLLTQPWPEELLQQPDGCEVWARRCAPQPPPQSSLTREQAGAGAGMVGPGALPVLLEGAVEGPSTDGTNTPTRGLTGGGANSDGGSWGANQPSRLRPARGPSPLRQATSASGLRSGRDPEPAPAVSAAPKPAALLAVLLDTSGPLQGSPTEGAAAAASLLPAEAAAGPTAQQDPQPAPQQGGQGGGAGVDDGAHEAVVALRPGALLVEEDEDDSDKDGEAGGEEEVERPSNRSSRPSAPSRALRPVPRPSATGLLAPAPPEGELILPVRPPPPLEDGPFPAPPPHPRPSGSGTAGGARPPRSSRRMLPAAACLSDNGFSPQPPPAQPQPAALAAAPALLVAPMKPELPELRQERSLPLAQGQDAAALADAAAEVAGDEAAAAATAAATVLVTSRRPSQNGKAGGAQAAPITAPAGRGTGGGSLANGGLVTASQLPRALPPPMSATGGRPVSGSNLPRPNVLPGGGPQALPRQQQQQQHVSGKLALMAGGSSQAGSGKLPIGEAEDEDDDEDDATRDWRKHINWNAEDATPPPLVSSLGSAFGPGYEQLAAPDGASATLPEPTAAHSPRAQAQQQHAAAAWQVAALMGGERHADGNGSGATLRATFDGSTGSWAPVSAHAAAPGDAGALALGVGAAHTKPLGTATLGRFRASLPRLFQTNASLPARPQLDLSNGGASVGGAGTGGGEAGTALRQAANVYGSSSGGGARAPSGPLKTRPLPMLHLATSMPAPGSALPMPGAPPPSRAASRTPASALAAVGAGHSSGASHALSSTAGRRGTVHRLSMALYRTNAASNAYSNVYSNAYSNCAATSNAAPFISPSATGRYGLNPSASMAAYGHGYGPDMYGAGAAAGTSPFMYGYGSSNHHLPLMGPAYATSPPASVTSEAPMGTPRLASGAGPRRGSLPRFVASLANSLRRSKATLLGGGGAGSSLAGAVPSESSLACPSTSPPSGVPLGPHPLHGNSGQPRRSHGDDPSARQDPSNHQLSRASSAAGPAPAHTSPSTATAGAAAAAAVSSSGQLPSSGLLMVAVAPLYVGPDDPAADADAPTSPAEVELGGMQQQQQQQQQQPTAAGGGGLRPGRASLMGGGSVTSPLDALWRDLNSVNSLCRQTDIGDGSGAGGGSGVAAWLASAGCTIGGVLCSMFTTVPPDQVTPRLRTRLTQEAGAAPAAGEPRLSSSALLAKLGGRSVVGGGGATAAAASAGSALMAAVNGLPSPGGDRDRGSGGTFSGYAGFGLGAAGGGGVGGAGAAGGEPVPVLAFRGLRVRVGLHSGVRVNEVVSLGKEAAGAAADYKGDVVQICKEVSDVAMGGMVVLSGSAFRALQLLAGGRGKSRAPEAMLLHLGEHVIKPPQAAEDRPSRSAGTGGQPDAPPPTRELYAAVFPSLACRLALLPSPVRTHSELVPGCLSAPAGLVAPVFCNVVGVEALLAWEALVQERLMRAAAVASAANLAACRPLVGGEAVAPLDTAVGGLGMVREALDLFGDMAQEAASRHGGYVVASSADGGHWVLVFGCAEAAVGWGLDMLQAMLTAEWPDGFLEHELTEEAWEGGVLVERGLRLRIGVDFGRAMVRLVPRSGRLDYVGRPMNRAARIAAKAKAASVLMSGAAWSAARPALGSSVAATNLGTMQLKGVKEQLELWEVRAVRTGDAEHYME